MDATGDFGLEIDTVVEHHDVELSEVRLHVVDAGTRGGKLVVLLHGFPEFWYSWRHQIAAMSQAGYHVVAPDQRGYNTSDKPPDVRAYEITRLVGDVVELLDHFDAEEAIVVGHDWGAVVAWFFAMMHPERTERLAILNVPHPVRFERGLKTFKQLRKSWYMGFFQLPVIPEKALGAFDHRAIRRLFSTDPVNPDAFSEADIERYVEALSQPGSLRGAVNWYRAALRTDWKPLVSTIDLPTLVIWGLQDLALGEELAEPPAEYVTDVRVERIEEASHWVQCDAPGRVNALLLHFMAGD